MKKRILSIMLALVMIVSLLPVGTFAAEAKCPGTTVTHTKANCDFELYETVAPTCNGFGYIVNKCLGCETLFVSDITENKGECNADGVVEHVDATCTEPGVVGVTYCTVCGSGKAEAEEAILPGHVWDTSVEADCTKGYPCTVCGEFSAPTAHTWVLLEIEEDPTHLIQKTGTAIYECSVCFQTKEVDILVHEHEFSVNAEKTPSCFETGVKAGTMKCAFCDTWQYDDNGRTRTTTDISKVSLPMVGHTEPATGVEITPADCVTKTNGLKKYTCAVCNEDQEEVLKWEEAHNNVLTGHGDANCTEYGFDTWVCSLCGNEETEFTDPLGHTPEKKYGYYVYQNKVDGDCENPGYTGDVNCSVCEEVAIEGEVIEATGHHYVEGSDSGNCITPSSTFMVCDNKHGYVTCGNIDETTRVWGALNPEKHADTSTKDSNTSVAATCCTDGIEYHKCDSCGETWEVDVPKLNHRSTWGTDYMKKVSTVEATCTEGGYEVWQCSYYNCGYIDENGDPAKYTEYRNPTEKLTHETVYDITELPVANNYSVLNTVRATSCDVDGLFTYRCDDCGAVFLVTEAAHHTVPTNATTGAEEYTQAPAEATCDQAGFTGTYICAICGEEQKGEEIPALGHTFDEDLYVQAVEVSCDNVGSYEGGFCTVCAKWLKLEADGTYTEVVDEAALEIPARGHWMVIADQYWVGEFDAWAAAGYDPETESEILYKHYVCNHGCGYEYISDDFHRHAWVENETLTVEPTCTASGSKTYECECGRTKVEFIGRLFHTYNGEKLVNECANNGIACDRCQKVMNKAHDFDTWTHVAANCSEGEHEIRFCKKCDAYEVNPLGDVLDSDNHQWGTPEEVKPGAGVYVQHCVLCGVKNDVNEVCYLPYIAKGDLTVGSILTVEVEMTANCINIWGFDIDVRFDNADLKFINAKAGENFNIYFQENDGYISVAGNANAQTPVEIDVVVTLTFEVLDSGIGAINVVHNTTATPEGERIGVSGDTHTAYFGVYDLGDVNKDFAVDILDVLAIYNFFVFGTGEFTELGDLNGDGEMDTLDMEALYAIIINN